VRRAAGLSIALAVSRLNIDTDQDNLFFIARRILHEYLDYINKFPENEAMYVLIEPADPRKPPSLSRWTELAERVAEKMRALTTVVSSVEYRTPVSELGGDAAAVRRQKRA